MTYLKNNFDICKKYVLNSYITCEDLHESGYSDEEIINLEKKNFLSKHIDSYVINNLDHLAYYMNKIDDSILKEKFNKKIREIDSEYSISYLKLFYLATLYGDYNEAYDYFKLLPRNIYTNMYLLLFSNIIDLPSEDVDDVKNIELEDILIGNEIDEQINRHIYYSKYVKAISLIDDKYNNLNYMNKNDAILKTLCNEANLKKKNRDNEYSLLLTNNKISECKNLIINESKKRHLNNNEKLILDLINDYDLVIHNVIPPIATSEKNRIADYIYANDFYMALNINKTDSNTSINILLKKIVDIINKNIRIDYEDVEIRFFQKKLNNYIYNVEVNNEIVLLEEELSYEKRIVLFNTINEYDNIIINRIGTPTTYKYVLMRNNPKVDLTAYYDCINIANQLYDNGDYNAAIEKYKDSIVALKKPGFESILKIAKCNHKLENYELACNYYMIDYYNAINSNTREKTHRFLANSLYSMGYNIKTDYRFYQILADLYIFKGLSIADLKREYYLKKRDEINLMKHIIIKLKELGLYSQAEELINSLEQNENNKDSVILAKVKKK